jgi:hypothetical protein
MATKTKSRNARAARTPRSRGRITGGRSTRRRSSAKPSGPMGLLNRVTHGLGHTGGRGKSTGGGFATKGSSFVSGFLNSGKDRGGRRRR